MKKLFLGLILLLAFVGSVQADSAPCVEQGDTIDLYVQFKDATGAPSAATSKEALIVDSAQATDTTIADGSFTQVASKTGWYTVPLTVGGADPVGSWAVHWEGTVGGVALAGIDYIEVKASGGECGAVTADIVDDVWDEPLTGATHNVATSSGRRLRSLGDVVDGEVDDASATASSFITDLTGLHDDHYAHQSLNFISGNLAGMSKVILSYNSSTKLITVEDAFPEAPADGDEFTVPPTHVHPITEIVNHVWDETATGHTDAGKAGAQLWTKIDTIEQDAHNIYSLIESQRGTHTATGNTYYWGPANGSDSNDCLTKQTACATFTHIHDNKVTAFNHDLVIALPDDSATPTVTNEEITISKAYTFLRGPGRDFEIEANVTNVDTVVISGDGIELSGMIVNTAMSGAKSAIVITGDFAFVHKVWVDHSQKYGVELNTSSNSIVANVLLQDIGQGGADAAIYIKGTTGGDAQRNIVRDIIIIEPDGDGIRITDDDGTGAISNSIVGEIIIFGATGWGVRETSGNENHLIGPTAMLHGNASGAYTFFGADSDAINVDEWAVPGDAMTLTAAAVDLILDEKIEGIYSMRDALCLISGVIAGKLSSSGGVASFRGLEDTEDRSIVTFAAGGQRDPVTFDLTGCQ